MQIAEFTKAITAGLSAAIAVEASGAVTGVADHYLTLGIGAVVALLGAFGITYIAPNKPAVVAAPVVTGPTDEFGNPVT